MKDRHCLYILPTSISKIVHPNGVNLGVNIIARAVELLLSQPNMKTLYTQVCKNVKICQSKICTLKIGVTVSVNSGDSIMNIHGKGFIKILNAWLILIMKSLIMSYKFSWFILCEDFLYNSIKCFTFTTQHFFILRQSVASTYVMFYFDVTLGKNTHPFPLIIGYQQVEFVMFGMRRSTSISEYCDSRSDICSDFRLINRMRYKNALS